MHPTDRVSGPADSVTTRRTAKGYQEAVQLSQQKEKASLYTMPNTIARLHPEADSILAVREPATHQ
jgi:hypothetical protein